jgi:hypothetical protein
MADRKSKPVQPIKADRKPKPAVEPKLTQLQEHIFDVLGDMILHGGHTDDVFNVLWNVSVHHQRVRFPQSRNECEEQFKERIEKRADDQAGEWQRLLTKSWPDPAIVNEAPAPKNVVQRVRATVSDRLQDRFADFMLDATPEEKRLLVEVFTGRGSLSMRPDIENAELELATAFMEEIGASERYVQVPDEEIKDLVVKYIKLLTQGREAA